MTAGLSRPANSIRPVQGRHIKSNYPIAYRPTMEGTAVFSVFQFLNNDFMKAKFIIPCIALAIAALMGTACSCQQLDGFCVPKKNFVGAYLIPESLSYSSYSDEFRFDGIWISDGEVLERMLEKYGDTVYNSSYFMPTNAVGVDFEKIEITSDMDFDSGHKAGESLA